MCKAKPRADGPRNATDLVSTLMDLYCKKVVPVEVRHSYELFHSPPLKAGEFRAKPVVMLLGQYSVGKTSMIKYLCGQEYLGSLIGPEPTTDRFTAVYYDEAEHEVQGTSLTNNPSLPFESLTFFGNDFASRLKGAAMPCPILKHVTFLDTPGILAGEKQTQQRAYDFTTVVRFLSDKVDQIVLMFDTTKLDISDEFKHVIQCLKGNEEKADVVDENELARVRGALMWGLSKIIETPEVPKVYIGSFTKDLRDVSIMHTFREDYLDLFHELQAIPGRCTGRKLNDLIKRAKAVQIHAQLMSIITGNKLFYSKTQKGLQKMLRQDRVEQLFHEFRLKNRLTRSDMPDFEVFRASGLKTPPEKWMKEDPKMMAQLDNFLKVDIPRILSTMKRDEAPSDSLRNCFTELVKAVEEAPSHDSEENRRKRQEKGSGDGKEEKKSNRSGREKKVDENKNSAGENKDEKKSDDEQKKNEDNSKDDKKEEKSKEDKKDESKDEKKEEKSKEDKSKDAKKDESDDAKKEDKSKEDKSKSKDEKRDENSKDERKDENKKE